MTQILKNTFPGTNRLIFNQASLREVFRRYMEDHLQMQVRVTDIVLNMDYAGKTCEVLFTTDTPPAGT